MRSVKDAGAEERDKLRRRIGRALGAKHITQEDHDYMRTRLDEIQERIDSMTEATSATA